MATTEELIHQIVELVINKENKALVPYAANYTKGIWWIYIEMNSKRRTFDFETSHTSRHEALQRALVQLKRELG